MSWQSYVDELMGSGHFDSVVIFGVEGDVFAKSPSSFAVAQDENHAFRDQFNSTAKKELLIAGEKYLVQLSTPKAIYGNKSGGGFLAVKTNQLIIFGVFGEGKMPAAARNAVERMAEYLESNAY